MWFKKLFKKNEENELSEKKYSVEVICGNCHREYNIYIIKGLESKKFIGEKECDFCGLKNLAPKLHFDELFSEGLSNLSNEDTFEKFKEEMKKEREKIRTPDEQRKEVLKQGIAMKISDIVPKGLIASLDKKSMKNLELNVGDIVEFSVPNHKFVIQLSDSFNSKEFGLVSIHRELLKDMGLKTGDYFIMKKF